MTTTKDAFKLVGLRLNCKTTNRDNQSSRDCGELWQQFEKDKIFDRIPYKLTNAVYAVYFEYEGDETAPFSYFIGCKVAGDAAVPPGLQELIIPAQAYQKYTAKGEMTGCITDTWKEIWNREANRSFGYDFEIYDERSHDWSNAEVDVFVSVGQ